MTLIELGFESHSEEELIAAKPNDVQDYINIIVAMKQQELSYACRDYLNESGLDVDEVSRAKMVKWCFQTVDYFKLSRNSAVVGMSCLDRFVSTAQGRPFLMDKALYQLACIASLQMAIKVHEPVELGLCLLVELCRGAYSEEQIVETEEMILNAIQWKVNPPSPKSFVQHFIAMLPQSVEIDTKKDLLDLACFQTEMALSDYQVGSLRMPSAVAFASLLNAMSLCPEISCSTRSQYLRTLGKTTGCTRHMEFVNDIQSFMQNELEVVGSSETINLPRPIDNHSHDRRSAFGAVRTKSFSRSASSQHSSPVAVTMESR